MKKLLNYKLATLVLLLICPVLHAQFQSGLWTKKQANYWYMGKARGLNFSTSPPQVLNDGQSYAIKGGGTISTPEGDLLFYTDGQKVWNRNHAIMPNGTSLSSGAMATQCGLTIPVPGNPNLYYVISVMKSNSNGGIFYSEVDMTLDGGLGNVNLNKKVRIHPAGVAEKLAAVHHPDEKKVWLVGHRANHLDLAHSNEFVSYLISENGINTTPIVSAVGQAFHQFKDGQMKFSADGTKIAIVHSQGNVGPNVLEIFNFDKTTGVISAPFLTIDDRFSAFGSLWGIEFSPNGKFLYVAESQGPSRIYQYDVSSGNDATIRSTENIIYEIAGLYDDTFFGMQTGIDGKIYVASSNRDHHSVINFPNNSGLACGFQYSVSSTILATSDDSFPGFIQSYFESGILYDKTCHGDVTDFSLIRIPGITSVSWNFGDTASSSNTSTSLEPTHVFTAPGTYTVTATIVSNGARQLTSSQVIINALPTAEKPATVFGCDTSNSGFYDFDLLAQDAIILNNQLPADFTVTYHTNNADAQSGNNAISGDLTRYNSDGEPIFARVENKITGCFKTTDFELEVIPSINPSGLQVVGCSPLNLTSVVPNLGIPANEITVTYHTSNGDAETGNNPINTPEKYAFTGTSGTIYLRIIQNTSACVDVVEVGIVQGDCSLPQGFSPNGDNVNDSFDLSFLASQNGISSLEVFNRNGRQVYKQNNYTNQWIGEDNNGNRLPTGTYFYVAKLKTEHPQYGKVITKWVYLQANN